LSASNGILTHIRLLLFDIAEAVLGSW